MAEDKTPDNYEIFQKGYPPANVRPLGESYKGPTTEKAPTPPSGGSSVNPPPKKD